MTPIFFENKAANETKPSPMQVRMQPRCKREAALSNKSENDTQLGDGIFEEHVVPLKAAFSCNISARQFAASELLPWKSGVYGFE